MMSGIFTFMILCGVIFGALTGRLPEVTAALLGEGARAVTLSLTLMGSICVWGGIMRVAERAGLSGLLAKAAEPLLARLFTGIKRGGAAMEAISVCLAANLLGLGNAATPLGIAAMKELKKEERGGEAATDGMALFVVMNTASLQLIPTTAAAMRAAAGSTVPFSILPAVWLSSAVSLTAGILAAKLLAGRGTR